MNKPTRLPSLQLSRTSIRPLQHDALHLVAGGRRATINSVDIGSACDPHCVSRDPGTP
jgi:hypothetical protein